MEVTNYSRRQRQRNRQRTNQVEVNKKRITEWELSGQTVKVRLHFEAISKQNDTMWREDAKSIQTCTFSDDAVKLMMCNDDKHMVFFKILFPNIMGSIQELIYDPNWAGLAVVMHQKNMWSTGLLDRLPFKEWMAHSKHCWMFHEYCNEWKIEHLFCVCTDGMVYDLESNCDVTKGVANTMLTKIKILMSHNK